MVAEKIYENVQKLPEPLQTEVLNFVEYLLLKSHHVVAAEDDNAWVSLSVDLAMRGMEDESVPEYFPADLKETFA